MHSESPIRQLDEIIRRYGVTCLQLVPFEGGYCVHLGSSAEPVTVGAGSLPEAIGKAFLKLIELKGGPSFEELLERSSLGTPEAKAMRASAPKEAVDRIIKKVHTYENPAVHWPRPNRLDTTPLSACGIVRGGTHPHYAKKIEDVTCGRCKNTSWCRAELRAKQRQQS